MKRFSRVLAVLLALMMVLATGASFAAFVEVNDGETGIADHSDVERYFLKGGNDSYIKVHDAELYYLERGTDSYSINAQLDFENMMFGGHTTIHYTNDNGPVTMHGLIMCSTIQEKIDYELTGTEFHGCGYYAFWLEDIPDNVEITSARAYYKEQGLHVSYDDIAWYYFGDKSKLRVSLGYAECVEFDLDNLDKTQVRVLDRENYYRTRTPGNTVMVTFVIEGIENGETFAVEQTISSITFRQSQPLSVYTTFNSIFRAVK